MAGDGGDNEIGAATAEFAVALPAVVLVLVGCLTAISVTGQQVRLQDAAAIAARSVARGESAATAAGRVHQLVARASLAVEGGGEGEGEGEGDLECVTLRSRAAGPAGLVNLTLSARSCALGAGQ